jgi:D-alanine-D-alanine ligase-like ATP-grasp enzyme
MLLEEFYGVGTYDQAVISYLELLRQPYTGCNPRGLLLSRDKALSKKILAYHRIPTPRFAVFPRHRRFHRVHHRPPPGEATPCQNSRGGFVFRMPGRSERRGSR